ncbi:hypothetical protein KSP39_PZI024384 [Platanthera zijinensis]|uniref:Uncharacterized protein n=1 Tax=Platanthera zijinensis TaxID=2320716 RepID=A0AAP0AUE0_9ASPA
MNVSSEAPEVIPSGNHSPTPRYLIASNWGRVEIRYRPNTPLVLHGSYQLHF